MGNDIIKFPDNVFDKKNQITNVNFFETFPYILQHGIQLVNYPYPEQLFKFLFNDNYQVKKDQVICQFRQLVECEQLRLKTSFQCISKGNKEISNEMFIKLFKDGFEKCVNLASGQEKFFKQLVSLEDPQYYMSKQNLDINSIKSQSDENIKEAALNELKEIKKPINYENFKAYLQKKNDLSIVIKVNLDGKFKSITVPLVIYKTK